MKWKISYLLCEQELIWSFQDVKSYCLVLLKIFLKWKLKFISEDITTYHIKNIVFWDSVNVTKQRKFSCIHKELLIRLRRAIDEQFSRISLTETENFSSRRSRTRKRKEKL